MSGEDSWWAQGNGRAVSQTIGVVLLVAIVVLLAGTVSYALLGVDRGRPATPQFTKIHDYDELTQANGEYLNVTHGSGEIVDTRNMTLLVRGAVVREQGTDNRVDDARLKSSVELDNRVGDQWVSSETLTIDKRLFEKAGSGTDVDSDTEYLDLGTAKVKIVWVPRNEGFSDVLYRWEGPDTEE